MRNLSLALAAAAMTLIVPVTPAATAIAAPSKNGALEFCRSRVSDPPQDRNVGTLGECTSFFIVPWDGTHPHACDFWAESGILEEFGFDSYPQCVRELREILDPEG